MCSSALALVMVVTSMIPAMAATPSGIQNNALLSSSLIPAENYLEKPSQLGTKELQANDIIRVIVELEAGSVADYAISKGLEFEQLNASEVKVISDKLINTMEVVKTDIKKQGIQATYFNEFVNVFNGFSASMTFAEAELLKTMPNVKSVTIAQIYEKPELPTPNMVTSVNQVKANLAWDLKFKGEGMVVAVLDSGFDPNHQDMQLISAPSKAKYKTASEVPTGMPGKWYNIKMPYAYDYYDQSHNLASSSDHGTHVAGTVLANGDTSNGKSIKGVAPEAQLLGMKVFGDDPSVSTTSSDIYLKAIDDAVALKADVINMSLGSTAGFVLTEEMDPARKAIRKATEAGVLVSISAGNSHKIGYRGTNMDPLVTNPDYGVTGSPSVNPEAFTVANFENTHVNAMAAVDSTGYKLVYNASSGSDFITQFGGKPVEYVYCGLGKPGDFPVASAPVTSGGAVITSGSAVSVSGKIALIQRGELTFVDKMANAKAAGAIAAIIFNSQTGGDALMSMTPGSIPSIFVGVTDGTKLKESVNKTITFGTDVKNIVNPAIGEFDDSTSWGTTPDLNFKPDLAAPGGNIYSTVQGGKYEIMSGTSMASPHVAGGTALVMQRADKDFGFKGKERELFARNILMSTAVPVVDITYGEIFPGIFTSPRRQGAGLMDLNAATTGKTIIIEPTTKLSKVALKEIKSNVVSFPIEIKSLENKAVTYSITGSVNTDLASTTRILNTPQPLEGAVITYTANGQPVNTVTVPAMGSMALTVTVDLTNAKCRTLGKTFSAPLNLETVFPNGGFVDGFVRLTPAEGSDVPPIGIPYTGFKGDWNKAPIFDVSNYDKTSTNIQYFGAKTFMAAYKGTSLNYLGYNSTTKLWKKDNIAFSPNNDGELDNIGAVLGTLRNAKEMEINILDEKGALLRTVYKNDNAYIRKNFDGSKTLFKTNNEWVWDGKINNTVKEGQYIYQVKAKIDFANAEWQVYNFPVSIDTTFPVLAKAELSTDKATLKMTATDNKAVRQFFIQKMMPDGSLYNFGEPDDIVDIVYFNAESNKEATINLGDFLEPGTTLIAGIVDIAGNMTSKKFSDPAPNVSDKIAPALDMTSPESGSEHTTNAIVFEGNLIDQTGIKSFTVDGKEIPTNYDAATNKYNFKQTINYADGPHSIKVIAIDKDNNKVEFIRPIDVDATLPVIKVTSALRRTVDENTKSIDVVADVSDNYSGLKVYVNGTMIENQAANLAGIKKSINKMVDLTSGLNRIVITAKDGFGNVTEEILEVYKKVAGENPVNVFTYAAKVNIVETKMEGNLLRINTKVSNLSTQAINPVLVVQVLNASGQVVGISTADLSDVKAGTDVKMGASFMLKDKGLNYTVEAYVWSNWESPKSLANPVNTIVKY